MFGFRFCEGHHLAEMKMAARDYIYQNFPEVTKGEEYLDTPKEILISFLQSEDLRVDSEFQV